MPIGRRRTADPVRAEEEAISSLVSRTPLGVSVSGLSLGHHRRRQYSVSSLSTDLKTRRAS
jgi:hypothetical protein